jgi:hypothetical protein
MTARALRRTRGPVALARVPVAWLTMLALFVTFPSPAGA